MNLLESAVNIGIMTQEGGAEYLYELANSSTLSNEEQVDILRDIVFKYYGTFDENISYEAREEMLDGQGKDVSTFLNSEFLYYVASRLILEIDWLTILHYHREIKYTNEHMFLH